MDWIEVVLRLGAATLIGCAVGVNRFAHHKPLGMRTLGLVALAAAALVAATLEVMSGDAGLAAASRAIQGIITGIGFIGAGVIVLGERDHRVHGLTTAATVWVSATAGILCGLGAWRVTGVVVVVMAIVLTAGRPIERWFVHRFGSGSDDPRSEG